eukprot:CAMPEP_0182910614 /NCGR_PEP_ID=MMETSP0034_2-20130328/36427_1 /TAXON_ID=156128 /ORGANISM="Nephroselmis pyriformis, Strain CCMP717" /LENGTH=45 /DNA_ID= /DNA_START= /DNA_END= /DNA_ORIENTATION=
MREVKAPKGQLHFRAATDLRDDAELVGELHGGPEEAHHVGVLAPR